MRLFTLFVLLFSASAHAQFGAPVAPCPTGTGEAVLRGMDVEASLYTNGNLFFGNQTTNGDGYLVPLRGEDAGKSPIFAANLRLGGRVGGEIRTSASRYGNFQLRPGLTGVDGTPPDTTACAAADRIAVLSGFETEASQQEEARDWPVHLGAPVIDGDGIPDNYDLAAGDRPAIRGDVMAFWAMTDTAVRRTSTGDPPAPELPLGVDVLAEAFAFRALPTTTFYRFTVVNRNSVAIEDATIGLWHDFDLGSPADDYIGADTTRHMVYAYNAAEMDDIYGVPPASGVVVARGPLAASNGVDDDGDGSTDEAGERMGLTAAPILYKTQVTGGLGPALSATMHYNRLLGLAGDGVPMYAYGSGRASDAPPGTPPTRFGFGGDPTSGSFWSQENVDGMGTRAAPGDRRGMPATGPVRLEPGESMDVTFAIVFAQGDDRLDSVTKLREQAEIIHRVAASDAFDLNAFTNFTLQPGPEPEPTLTLTRPRPNPFSDTATLRFTGASGAGARVSVYDVLGRRLSRVEVADAPEASVEVGAGLPSGVYVVHVEGLGFAETFTIVKAQ